MAQQATDYSTTVNFNIPTTIPENTPDNMKGILNDILTYFQSIIKALVNNCGIGPQLPSQWSQYATMSGSTVLAGNMGRLYATAKETIVQGALVNFTAVAGVLQAQNANATDNTKMCQGYCSTPGGLQAGIAGEFIEGRGTIAITGLTVGSKYYLSRVNGLITTTAPVAAGNIEQYVGFAAQANLLVFHSHYYVQH